MTMKNPPIRFKDDNGQSYPDVEQTTFGSVYTERKEKGDDSLQILSVSIHTGVSDQELDEYNLGKEVRRSEDKSVYKRAESGDLVFNMMRAWQGAVGSVTNAGMVSPAYIVAKPDGSVDPVYIDYLVQTKKAIYEFDRLSYGVTDFRKRLYWESFVKVPLNLPSFEEQKKIAALFRELDNLISATSNEISALEVSKKDMMQKIFSQEIRFRKNDGSEYEKWEIDTISNLGIFHGGLSGKSKNDFGVGNSKYITYMNVYRNTFTRDDMLENVAIGTNEKQFRIKYGDILFTQSSENVEEVGMSSVWMHSEQPYLNSFCMALRPHNLMRILPKFSGYLMRCAQTRRRIMVEGQGISRINIAPSRLGSVEISFPSNIEEQQKIANLLSSMDDAISAAKDELQGYKDLKKYLLQNMFA